MIKNLPSRELELYGTLLHMITLVNMAKTHHEKIHWPSVERELRERERIYRAEVQQDEYEPTPALLNAEDEISRVGTDTLFVEA